MMRRETKKKRGKEAQKEEDTRKRSGTRGAEISPNNPPKEKRRTSRKRSMGSMGRWFFLVLMTGQSFVGVDAASGQMKGMYGERKINGKQLGAGDSQKLPNVEIGAKRIQKCMVHITKRYSVEHGEEIHQMVQWHLCNLLLSRAQNEERRSGGTVQFKKPNKVGNVQPMQHGTDENASSEDRKHTLEGVFVAADRNPCAVITEEGAVVSTPSNEGRIAEAWVNVLGSVRVFSVHFWHLAGWTPRSK